MKVHIHERDAHIRPECPAPVLFSSGSGTEVVARDLRVNTVDCVPSDSLAQEYFALGTNCADPAIDLARDSNVCPPSWDTSSPPQEVCPL